MNKKDLTDSLLSVLSTRKEATDAIEKIFGSMRDSLRRNEKVVISGFGSFHVRLTSPRKCKAPNSDRLISVPSRPKVKFKPSRELIQKYL